MKTLLIPKDFQHMSPAGAEVRVLLSNPMGGIAHCTLRANIISKPVKHKSVSELWHVIQGKGQIWRKNGSEEQVSDLNPGISIDIPLGTEFQYRSDKDTDLVFLCVTMPPWPGADEVTYLDQGKWQPT